MAIRRFPRTRIELNEGFGEDKALTIRLDLLARAAVVVLLEAVGYGARPDNLLPWLFSVLILGASCSQCSNDRSQEKGHLSKRQSLKRKQREAMLARKEVNSVVDKIDERTAVTPTCTCVRTMPDAGGLDAADVYRRLEEEASSKSPSKVKVEKKQLLEAESTQKSSPEEEKSTKTKSDEMKTKMSSSKQKSTSVRIENV